jgi:hypothetical protein
MGGIEKDRHRPWLGYSLDEALRRSLFSAKDVVAHANPEALVAQLPHQVIGELLSRALVSGTFSAAAVLETAPPALLAEYLDAELLWRCLKDVADRAGLVKKGGTRTAQARQWLGAILQRALEAEMVLPADVLHFVPPAEFVSDAPKAVVAELIKNGLTRGTFDPVFVLQHLTPAIIADTLETSLVWDCLADGVARRFEIGAGASSRFDDPTNVTPPPTKLSSLAKDKLAADKKSVSLADKLVPPVASKTGSTVRPPVAPLAKAEPAEWQPADDLDVLEEGDAPPLSGHRGNGAL